MLIGWLEAVTGRTLEESPQHPFTILVNWWVSAESQRFWTTRAIKLRVGLKTLNHHDVSFLTFKIVNIPQTEFLHQVCHGEEDNISFIVWSMILLIYDDIISFSFFFLNGFFVFCSIIGDLLFFEECWSRESHWLPVFLSVPPSSLLTTLSGSHLVLSAWRRNPDVSSFTEQRGPKPLAECLSTHSTYLHAPNVTLANAFAVTAAVLLGCEKQEEIVSCWWRTPGSS